MTALGRLALAALPPVLGACGGAGETTPARNLILVSIDTLRADRLGCYGYGRPTSPNLDRIAAEGTLFEDASSTSPWTLPSHASLFTGLYPQRHGALHMDRELVEDARPVATLLREAGFATRAVVSSTILEGNGLERGFDVLVPVEQGGPGPSQVTARTVEQLDLLLAEEQGRPFFLLVHYIDPHSDYGSLPEFQERFVGDYDGPATGESEQLFRFVRGELEFDAQDRRHLSDLYDAGVCQLDDQVGRLMDALARRDLLATSLLVVTSDHGEEFFEHGQVMHGLNHYDETMRVPLILRGPRVPAGLRVPQPVSLVDVLPTCLALLGLAVPEGLDGWALEPLLRAPGTGLPERRLYAEADFDRPRGRSNFLGRGWDRAVRRGRFKLHYNEKSGRTELYDLEADPGETRDVASEHPEVERELLADLQRYLGSRGRELGPVELTPEQLEAFRALGYAGDDED